VTWVGVAGFEPAASSSRTSGASGQLTVVPASWVCWRSWWLAAVRGRCCTSVLYLMRPSTCLQSDVSTRVSGSDLGNRLSLSDRDVPLGTEGNGTLMARDLGLAALLGSRLGLNDVCGHLGGDGAITKTCSHLLTDDRRACHEVTALLDGHAQRGAGAESGSHVSGRACLSI
jgi:hypothetical protein